MAETSANERGNIGKRPGKHRETRGNMGKHTENIGKHAGKHRKTQGNVGKHAFMVCHFQMAVIGLYNKNLAVDAFSSRIYFKTVATAAVTAAKNFLS